MADEQQEGTMALTIASGDGEVTVSSSGGEVAVVSCGEECRAKKRGWSRKEQRRFLFYGIGSETRDRRNKEDVGNVEAADAGFGHAIANAVRLPTVGSQTGGLTGVSGQSIMSLRKACGDINTVLSPYHLHPCASLGEIPAVLRKLGC